VPITLRTFRFTGLSHGACILYVYLVHAICTYEWSMITCNRACVYCDTKNM
jgi:hypothetical protein